MSPAAAIAAIAAATAMRRAAPAGAASRARQAAAALASCPRGPAAGKKLMEPPGFRSAASPSGGRDRASGASNHRLVSSR